MSEFDKRDAAPADGRQPWQPLGYDKIGAAEAELTFTPAGVDGASYS